MKRLYPEMKFRNPTCFAAGLKLNFQISGYLGSYHGLVALIIVCTFFITPPAFSQSGINAFTYQTNAVGSGKTYSGPGIGIGAQTEYFPTSNNTLNYKFGTASGYATGLMPVSGYVAGGSSFSVISNIVTSVVMRRVNNAVISGNRDILFFAGNRNPNVNVGGQTSSSLTLSLNAAYVADMSVAFSQNNLLIGTDNIFSNQGNGNDNNNNIERVDVLISGGFQVPDASKYGFPVLERGVYGAHDSYKIAVITALDGTGKPSAYSKVISVTSSSYNNTNGNNPVADGTYTYFLFKRDGINDLEVDQHTTNQGIGGASFRFSDFAIGTGTTIYGYSLMANDFNSSTGSDVVDYTNVSRYPTNTSESTGGLDILAVMGLAMETISLPVELSSFTAFGKNGKSTLEWTTLTEMNNRGFDIERSGNGRVWVSIGFLSSKANSGNSSQRLNYSFIDNNALNGLNYYRIRQTDFDNHESYSEIRIVSMASGDAATIRTFPNPAGSTIFVQGIEPGNDLRITDMKGALVSNTIATASIEKIPAGKLNPGVYLLQVIKDNMLVKTLKVVKL